MARAPAERTADADERAYPVQRHLTMIRQGPISSENGGLVDYQQLFVEVSKRPGMYGLDGSFGQFVAFLNGVDAGNDLQLLAGFPEWPIVRLGDGNNLAWSGLVLHS